MVTMHWNYKDLFRACRLGFSAKKIWMQIVGLVLGGAGYALLTYVAYLASGVPVAAAWERFSLIPFFDPHFASSWATINLHWWSWAIWGLRDSLLSGCCLGHGDCGGQGDNGAASGRRFL